MNYLKGKSVYLAGAMQCAPNSGIQWRQDITPRLKEFGITVYDPTHKVSSIAEEIGENKDIFRKLILAEKWKDLKETFKPVAKWDLRRVDLSDFIIVNYAPTYPSTGTWHEMVVCQYQNKPTLLVYNKKDLQHFNPWVSVLVRPEHLFSSWELLFEYLAKVNAGEIDRDTWTI
jgi:nucleoside 2-deoxyribosyltransferase